MPTTRGTIARKLQECETLADLRYDQVIALLGIPDSDPSESYLAYYIGDTGTWMPDGIFLSLRFDEARRVAAIQWPS